MTTEDGPAVPVLPAHDLDVTLDFYASVGFEVRRYDDGYAFVRRGPIELHLSRSDEVDPFSGASVVYIPVQDADRLHAEFAAAGLWHVPTPAPPEAHAEVRRRWQAGESIARLGSVRDTPWGIREFALLDPTNNLLRFGQRLG